MSGDCFVGLVALVILLACAVAVVVHDIKQNRSAEQTCECVAP